ncbi:hypothetical protein L3556_00120 [Candidatus Synechococcus calcipolaris G9]|uniref:Uncharacterized protein n=1 Tax=Candidatus Synechococcus calcipolaris G9 TaxID=1497997 RepID=A0ABT6ETT7_9SYNE|nr:hypothetical protein [Candidatus Synechococcus calcipolaris]MDG2989341.1 hypothetical protein [Candidatus Synechococcus calcipolaris G9]
MLDKLLNRRYERLMAIIASANLLVMLFDLTYVPFRNFWLLGHIPLPLTQRTIVIPLPVDITPLYDPMKGIEPHRETAAYLEIVDQLETTIQQQGVNSEATAALLEDLRDHSSEMIDTNPFLLAEKTGTLERIKNLMRDQVFGTTGREASARESFNAFWGPEYMNEADWQTNLAWFQSTISPLIQTNYWRAIGEDGQFINRVGVLDIPFSLLFFIEFLGRTYWLQRRNRSSRWLDAIVVRWYDIVLFFPFWWLAPTWVWLRIVPVAIRLDQAQLISLKRIREQSSESFVAAIAEDVSEVVVLQVLSQLQGAVRRGQVARWLPRRRKPSLVTTAAIASEDEVDELAQLASLVLQITTYKVLPQLRPDIESLVAFSIEQTMLKTPPYRYLMEIPGFQDLPHQWRDQLARDITARFFQMLDKSQTLPPLLDTEAQRQGSLLVNQLVQNFGHSFSREMQQEHVGQAIQDLLIAWLEDAKINFIRQVQSEGVESVLLQSREYHDQLDP